MESAIQKHGSEWPYFDLSHSLNNTKISKKVFLVDRFRNDSALRAVKAAALLQRGCFGAGFSILDLIHSIPQHIQTDTYYLQDSRRQLQNFNKVPAWRYAKPELGAVFYQLAMLQQAQLHDQQLTPFSLNLTPEFTNKAFKHDKGFIDYTKRQLDKAFKSELNRKLQYWFVVEFEPALGGYTRGNQRPHLHGAILINESDRESVRKQKAPISAAFHKAVGRCSPDFSNRLLHLGNHKAYAESIGLSELEAVINWPGYCTKHNTMARLILNTKLNLTADNVTKSQAEALYGHLNKKPTKPAIVDGIDIAAILAQI